MRGGEGCKVGGGDGGWGSFSITWDCFHPRRRSLFSEVASGPTRQHYKN
jgi:hypothetical protein